MSNKDPVQSEKFKSKRFKRLDNTTDKLGSYIFSIRLPVEAEKKYLEMSPKERVTLMRKTLVDAVTTNNANQTNGNNNVVKPPFHSQKKRRRKKKFSR